MQDDFRVQWELFDLIHTDFTREAHSWGRAERLTLAPGELPQEAQREFSIDG